MSTGFASADPRAARYPAGSFGAVDQAIGDGAATAFALLERLVPAPSTAGQGAPAQEIAAAELTRLGFSVSPVPNPPDVAARAPGGAAQLACDGRADVLGRMNPGTVSGELSFLSVIVEERTGNGTLAEVASPYNVSARTLARFIARYFAAGGLPGEPAVIRPAGGGT